MRTALLVVQVLGAFTLLAYPGVFLAGIMSFAAADEEYGPLALVGKMLLAASFFYPLIWAFLWWSSWQALRQNRPRRALLLSSPPALVVAAFFLLTASLGMMSTGDEYSPTAEIEHATKQNALAGALLSFREGQISAEALHAAVQRADTADLSRPVEPTPIARFTIGTRSPLAIALAATGLAMAVPLRAVNHDFIGVARSMMACGARLAPDEIAEAPDLVWLAEVVAARTPLPDSSVEQENPIAWIVLTYATVDYIRPVIAKAVGERRALLSTPTRTYGTPLRIALTRSESDAAHILISEGAVLSPAEGDIPSLNYQLEELLREYPSLRDLYFRSRYQAAPPPP